MDAFSCSFLLFLSFLLSFFLLCSFFFLSFPFLLSFFLLCYEGGYFCEFSQSKFSWIEEVSLQSLFCFLDNCTSPNTAELWPGCQEVPSPTGGKWEPQEPGTGQPRSEKRNRSLAVWVCFCGSYTGNAPWCQGRPLYMVLKDNNFVALGAQMHLGVWSKGDNSL